MLHRRSLAVLAAGVLCAGLARAAPADRDREYGDCLRQVDKDAAAAFETSNSWAERGGGYAARHCGALALFRMGQYEQAAMRLEQLASDMTPGQGRLPAHPPPQPAPARP